MRGGRNVLGYEPGLLEIGGAFLAGVLVGAAVAILLWRSR